MKVLKTIIAIIILCIQVTSVHGMESVEYGPVQFKADSKLLKKTIYSATTKNNLIQFLSSSSQDNLDRLIKASKYILSDNNLLASFCKEFQLPLPELQGKLKKIIKFSKDAIYILDQKHNIKVKTSPQQPILSRTENQPKIVTTSEQLLKTQLVISEPKIESKSQSKKEIGPIECKEQFFLAEPKINLTANNYTIYIMLDVQDFNANSKPICWQNTIQKLICSINSETEFESESYHHITLGWYKSEHKLTEKALAKLKKALNNANEILKIVYSDGIHISLKDGAFLAGPNKNIVAFKVAKSVDLIKLHEIVQKFLYFENLGGFTFGSFETLHVSLGKIIPKGKGLEIFHIVRHLEAPDGARAALGEDFTVNMLRASHSSSRSIREQIGEYTF